MAPLVARPSAPFASSPAVRRRMQAVRGRDTRPELELRRLLWRAGLRYRVDTRPVEALRRRADIVFTRDRLAVFVDGCYWHGCAEHGHMPSVNGSYWSAKLTRNVERDRETDAALMAAGWQVLRIWEHEDLSTAAVRIERHLRSVGS